jgi:glycosyltransferase involved in cell wall biosynthesis
VKIGLVAPPLLPVPPARYGGVERIVAVLADELDARGHDVTLFAAGDSTAGGRLVPTVPRALWQDGFVAEPALYFARSRELVLGAAHDFDVIHSHLDDHGLDLARDSPVPVVSTIHARTDTDPLAERLAALRHGSLVAISESQRCFVPDARWLATIHHGLPLASSPQGDGRGGYLLFLGRLSADKGVAEAVEVARVVGVRLVIAAKALAPNEAEVYSKVVAPAVSEGIAEFVGEVDEPTRDQLLGGALATVMMSRWPEPFGLVAIESLATGTPVIAQRSGALPEIVIHGRDGYIVDGPAQAARALASVAELNRAAIRASALARFSAERMVDEYEDVYARAIAHSQGVHSAYG